jgi:membrane protein DedA with SNARE-associated domain
MDSPPSISHLWQAIVFFFENVNLQDLIQHHRNWFDTIVFVWTFLQGETFIIFAGAAAAQDVVDIKSLIFFTWLGSFCGDQFCFWLGRKYGRRWLTRFPKLDHLMQRILARLERHDRVFILFYRFIYGVRNVSPFALGMSHLTWKEYTTWNAMGALLAALGFSLFGYLFGEALENVLGEVHGVMMGMAVVVICIFAAKYIHKKWKKKREKANT